MRVSMVGSGGDGCQCNNRQPSEVGAEPVNGSAEREPGDIERHGHGGHNGDDAFDLEAEGLIGGDGDSHGVVGKGGESGACPWGVSGLWRAFIVPMLRRVALCVVPVC
jgi:hypothetical protein